MREGGPRGGGTKERRGYLVMSTERRKSVASYREAGLLGKVTSKHTWCHQPQQQRQLIAQF